METEEETVEENNFLFVLSTHQYALHNNAHSVSLKFTERPFAELYLAMTFIFL